ncbi:MAG: tRNA pseudouridine(38-40) synthase TruA [Oscillospiraceae bacterium]|nr:tRNA pseudouridine(38-40) synthase TruA [Oscillospiraceae bacterium]
MTNLKAIIAYNGTAYHGFQKQNNALTIQEVLETALTKLLKHNVSVTGCSRTDAGVHARGFCFNAKTNVVIPPDGFVKGINALLPHDIAVISCEIVDDNFHARFDAKAKEYIYIIHTGVIRDVFMQNLAYYYTYARQLNISLMQKASNVFIGEHDFSAYCKAESLNIVKAKKHGTVRQIYDLCVSQKSDNYIEIKVTGNGFLHNMVRIIAGTLLYIGEGRLSLDDVQKSLTDKKRELAGKTLPARGLYLNRVFYEEGAWI